MAVPKIVLLLGFSLVAAFSLDPVAAIHWPGVPHVAAAQVGSEDRIKQQIQATKSKQQVVTSGINDLKSLATFIVERHIAAVISILKVLEGAWPAIVEAMGVVNVVGSEIGMLLGECPGYERDSMEVIEGATCSKERWMTKKDLISVYRHAKFCCPLVGCVEHKYNSDGASNFGTAEAYQRARIKKKLKERLQQIADIAQKNAIELGTKKNELRAEEIRLLKELAEARKRVGL
jgi:hypothetical protein